MTDHNSSARDTFPIPLRCPKCGHTGTAMWEENSRISPAGPEPSLASVSTGFYPRERANDLPQIVCQQCETVQPG